MKKLLTTKECADYLQVHPQTLYDWIKAKKIPYKRVGKKLRFKMEEIEKWLERNHEKSN